MNEEKWIKQYKEMQEFYEKRIKHLEESLESAMELNRKLMSMVVEVRENRDECEYKRPRCHIKKKPAQHARPSITSEVNTVLARVGILDQCQSTRKNPSVQPSKSG